MGALLEGQRKATIRMVEDGKQKVLRDDWTGTVERVNGGLLTTTAGRRLPAGGRAAGQQLRWRGAECRWRSRGGGAGGRPGADTLLLLSNVPGLLRAFPDESSLIPQIARAEVEEFLPVAQGRMKKKVLGAAEALSGGVGRVILGDARSGQPISRALAGQGTVIA